MYKKYCSSKRHYRTNNIKFIQPLLQITKVSGFYPPYNFRKKTNSASLLYITYSLVLQIVMFTYSTIIFCISIFYDELNTTTFLRKLSMLLYTCLTVFSNFGTAFRKRKNYFNIIKNIIIIEDELQKFQYKNIYKKSEHSFNFNFLIADITCLYSLIGIIAFYDLQNVEVMENIIESRLILPWLMFYLAFFLFANNWFLVINIVSSLMCKFAALNEILYVLLNRHNENDHEEPLECVQRIRCIFTNLSDVVYLINATFGFLFFFIAQIVLCTMLDAANIGMVLGFKYTSLLVSAIFWLFIMLVSPN